MSREEKIGNVIVALHDGKTVQVLRDHEWSDCDFSVVGSPIPFVVEQVFEGVEFRVKPDSEASGE